jgi:hypothetical protein
MFNTRTFFGTDGTLTVANAESAMDDDTLNLYFGEGHVVGRVANVSVAVTTNVHAWHEMGWRLPRELRAGSISIAGTVERAYVNGALLRLMLGEYPSTEEATEFTIPQFDMVLELDNQVPPGQPGNSVLTVYGVIFDQWCLELPAEHFTIEKVHFQAQRVGVADTEVPA